jgi:hypothetical protein
MKFGKLNSDEVHVTKKDKAVHERPPSELGRISKEEKIKTKPKVKKVSVKKST